MDGLGGTIFRLLKSSVLLRSLIVFFRCWIVAIFLLVFAFFLSFLINVGVFRLLVRCEVSSVLLFRHLICINGVSSSSSWDISSSSWETICSMSGLSIVFVESEHSSVFVGSKFLLVSGSVFWKDGTWRHSSSWVWVGAEFGDSNIKLLSSSGKLRSQS